MRYAYPPYVHQFSPVEAVGSAQQQQADQEPDQRLVVERPGRQVRAGHGAAFPQRRSGGGTMAGGMGEL